MKLQDIALVNSETVGVDKLPNQFKYVEISSVGSGQLIERVPTISAKAAPSRARRRARIGDVLVSTVRPNRRSFLRVNQELDGAIVSTGFAVLRPRNPRDSDFIYGVIRDPNFTDHLVAHAEGSAYPAVNPKFISSYELTDFCAVERQRIGDILRPFDDKIDCNSCLSTTLEEMSQALFKSWFVDFDPVVAKSAGRKPFGMSDDIAALFPDSFEESELGAVPKGWRVFGIGEISHNYDSKRIPLSASQRAIRQGSFPYYGAAGQIDLVDDYIFDGDFVLVGEDGSVVTPQGTPMLQFVTGKFWVNNHAHVLQGKGLITNELLYLCLHDQQIDGLVTGAVQPKLTQANLNSIKVPLPTEDNLMKAFTDIVRVFFDKIKLSREENSTLTSSRQILLTRLLSEGADFRIEGVRSTEATAA